MNRETKIKIISTGVFVILILVTVYLIYYSNLNKDEMQIKSVKVTGNNLLTENDYLNFTKLRGENIKELNAAVIRDRFQKHPYVKKAEIRLSGDSEVIVSIEEKNIYGLVFLSTESIFISENFEVLPVFPNTKISDFTILSNVRESSRLKPLSKIKSEDVIQAFRIIDAAKQTDEAMYKNLAEINLRNGGDAILYFSGMNTPVIFGKGNEAAKIVSLESLIKNYTNLSRMAEDVNYIDLRFNNKIYLGSLKQTEL